MVMEIQRCCCPPARLALWLLIFSSILCSPHARAILRKHPHHRVDSQVVIANGTAKVPEQSSSSQALQKSFFWQLWCDIVSSAEQRNWLSAADAGCQSRPAGVAEGSATGLLRLPGGILGQPAGAAIPPPAAAGADAGRELRMQVLRSCIIGAALIFIIGYGIMIYNWHRKPLDEEEEDELDAERSISKGRDSSLDDATPRGLTPTSRSVTPKHVRRKSATTFFGFMGDNDEKEEKGEKGRKDPLRSPSFPPPNRGPEQEEKPEETACGPGLIRVPRVQESSQENSEKRTAKQDDLDEEMAMTSSLTFGKKHSMHAGFGAADKSSTVTLEKEDSGVSIYADETKDEYMEISADDLVDAVGVSAMCLFDPDHTTGISQLPHRIAVPLVALQSMGLQIGLLWYMIKQLRPRASYHTEHPLNGSIVFIAIYLHFLNCVQELPYAIQIFRYFTDFHHCLEHVLMMGWVLLADAIIIPLISFCVGALYLCTSRNIGDVILNAVAVAFVREIDNWIIQFDTRANVLGGKVQSEKVHIPVSTTIMRSVTWWTVFIPVIPVLSTLIMMSLGFYYFEL